MSPSPPTEEPAGSRRVPAEPGARARVPAQGAGGGRLPSWLAPREAESPGTGRVRLIETTLLVLLGVLLATATVADVIQQTHVNERLVADLRTWRAYTGHDYRDISIGQDFHGHTTREVLCANTAPGPPKARVQLCLVISGPVLHGRRAVPGGWYLPPGVEDLRGYRYGCFGSARGQCTR